LKNDTNDVVFVLKKFHLSCFYPAAAGDPAYPVIKMFITGYAGSPAAAG